MTLLEGANGLSLHDTPYGVSLQAQSGTESWHKSVMHGAGKHKSVLDAFEGVAAEHGHSWDVAVVGGQKAASLGSRRDGSTQHVGSESEFELDILSDDGGQASQRGKVGV